MKNNLLVKRLSVDHLKAIDLPQVFGSEGIVYHEMGVSNWAETYPYRPAVQFAIAHNGRNIFLHYKVKEQCVRAVEGADLGHVWEDSCCEFFVSPDAKGGYYNLEATCIGTILLCNGQGREARTPAPDAVFKDIDRWASLGREVFGQKDEPTAWELALVIPIGSFFRHDLQDLSGCQMKANFYKCGDKTKEPHFLSWQKVDVPKPDFHRPDFFGELVFE